MNKKLKLSMVFAVVCGFFSCSNHETTINSELQMRVKNTFRNELMRDSASGGYVIIMDVHSGEILSSVGFKGDSDGVFVEDTSEIFLQGGESALMLPVSALAAFESGKVKMQDTVDTECGVIDMRGRILRDHNWRRGGYGVLSMIDGIKFGSNITVCRAVQKAYGLNDKRFYETLEDLSYGKPDSVEGACGLSKNVFQPYDSIAPLMENVLGYKQCISPLQTLAFYNAFANDGRMVAPSFVKGKSAVISPRITDRKYLDMMKQMFEVRMTGFMQPVGKKKALLGYGGLLKPCNNSYSADLEEKDLSGLNRADFCAFYPVEHPKYIIISSIQKHHYPLTWRYNYEYVLGLIKYLK